MIVQIALALLLSGSPQVQYDPQEAVRAEQFREQLAGTEDCLHGMHIANLSTGLRDRKQLIQLAAQECGSGLHFFMGDILGRPKKEIDAFLITLSSTQLDVVLSESR